MKVNELMVGDWVYDSANECDVQVTYKDFRNDCIRVLSDFKPIPLTPEILKKNGFRDISDHTLKGAETYCLTMGEYCEIKIIYKLGDYFAYDYYDDRWYRQFETSLCYRWCVHNLQHALKLCGIEKEIQL